MLHPFVKSLVESMRDLPSFSDGTPDQARHMILAGRNALGFGPKMHQANDIEILSRAGMLPVRLLLPKADPKGLIVYLHGGGWVLASIDDYDTFGRTLANACQCAVLLPEYRLAPEHPFPAALHDVQDTLEWASDYAKTEYSQAIPLIVAGDSAGANLATVAIRKLVGKLDIELQILFYPVTDCKDDRESYLQHGEGLPLSASDMRWFFNHYAPEDRWEDPDISPLRATDISGMPPTIISLAEYDVLHDEGAEYAQALSDANVETTVRTIKGMTHGFIRLHNLCEPAEAELRQIADEISNACKAFSSKPAQ